MAERADEDNYYKMLGCNPTSSAEQIAAEFKHLARKYHPDKVEGSDEKKKAEKHFTRLEKARSVLLDPKMRAMYDHWRTVGLHISFDDWIALQSRLHGSIHWAKPQTMPSLPQHQSDSQSSSHDKSAELNNPLEEFRQEAGSGSDLLRRFRDYGI